MNPIAPSEYIRILPEIVLTVFGMAVMLIDPFLPEGRSRRGLGWFAFAGCLLAVAAALYQRDYTGVAFFNMVRVDAFSIFFHVLIPAISAVCILASLEYMEKQAMRGAGEYYGLILFGTVGMVLMSSAVELVLIFIALEISSIATYILAGYRRRSAASAESSLKYFLLGSFATAFFLYGVALVFGATGSTQIYQVGAVLGAREPGPLVYLATALMFVGLAFKIASAPFHLWTPDVYEGAPSPVVALMSTAPKAAVFAVMLRIVFAASAPGWFWLLWISAVVSMFVGNFGALVQNNVKRMLAYSSIAHAGYLLVAFAASRDLGIAAAIFYTATYAAMNVGAFVVVTYFGGEGERLVTVDDYSGLAHRRPVLAAVLTVFMLSLIGIPLTGGFFAKFYVFNAALESNLVWLTVLGVANSALAAYYYLRLVVVMYMRESGIADDVTPRMSPALVASLAVATVATLWLGISPGAVLDYANRGAAAILR